MRNDQPEGGRRHVSAKHWCRIWSDRGMESDYRGGSTAAGERAANAAQVRNTAVLVPVVVVCVRMRSCDYEPQAQDRRQQAADAKLPAATEAKCRCLCHCLQRRYAFFESEKNIAQLIVASAMAKRAFVGAAGHITQPSCSANVWMRPPSRTTSTV
jgi:hypothetical protein